MNHLFYLCYSFKQNKLYYFIIILNCIMGVKNLWHLLSVAARTIDIKSLEGIIVAVDVSIWMIKILHGMAKSGAS